MHLNSLAGRSYYDITQYPVFPWIINVYAMRELPLHVLSPEIIFRNLVKTMGSLGDQERIKTFRERYEHTDDFDPVPNYHFGSHYSSPAIIMQYLIRLAPYSEGHKELQGGKFDLADRLFFSLQESFKGATEEISDVRELIPEFFYCPEFLLNLENSNFGVQQTGNRVHNVKLPLWSYKPLDNSNPYNFIKMHREFLEGEYVSENINNWIDLIFGYKQRGREAVNNLNTFFYLTYEDGIDLEKLENERFRVCYESQIIHFGQTPKQIFLKPHPSRPSLYEFNKKGRILTDPEYQIKSYKYSLDKKKGNNEGNETIIFIKFISENKIGVIKKNGAVYYYEWADSATWIQEKITPFRITPEKEVQANFDQREFEGAQCFLINHVKVGFLKDGKVIVTGGYMNGCLKLFSFEFNEEMPVKYNYHQDAITVLEIDFKERFLITGCKSGECIYWKINSGHKLKPKYMYYDHEGEILSLHISNDMKAFITGGIDQKIFIYNQINGKILKSLLHPDQHPVNNICLSSTPLAISIFYSVQNQMLYSYSINGQLMEKVKEDALVISNLEICKSLDGLDVLVNFIFFTTSFYLFFRFIQQIKGRLY